MFPGYDGRNRTFFLVNYEGTRIDRGATSFYTVPTPEQLAGRFSTTIIDPATGAAFANNTIPQSRFSRLAQLAIRNNWFPAPNSSAPQGNYQAVRTFPQVQDQFTLRGDQDLAKFGRAFFRYTKTTYENRTAGSVIDAGDRVFVQDTNNWQVSHSWPIKNTLVNQFRIGRVDARPIRRAFACPQARRGLPRRHGHLHRHSRRPARVSEHRDDRLTRAPAARSTPTRRATSRCGTSATRRTWVSGNHTLNFGFNYRRWWLQRDLATGFLGNYAFNVGFTGNRVADMLLGYYSGVGIFQPAAFSVPGAAGNPREFNFKYFAPYFQDDWRVNSRLTVNLGLRWDYRNVPYETRNRMAWRNLDYAPGGLLVADESLVDGGIVDGAYYKYAGRRSPENPDRFKVFAPRIGFAWRPIGEETVIRGGYGVFFDSAEGREIDGAADVYPYVSRGNYIQSVGQPTPLQTTDSLFPSFAAPGVATPAANTFLAVSQSPQPRNPYMQQWSLGVQREIVARTTLELNYIGTHGTNLLMRRNIAQALPVRPGQPPVGRCPQAVPQLRRLHRQRLERAVELQRAQHQAGAPRARLDPHASPTRGRRAPTSNRRPPGSARAASTAGRASWTTHDPERDYGLSDFDVDHRLVGSFVYNLPFGNGEKFAGNATGVKNAVVGGWQVNGIYTWQRGFPITITAADLGGLNDTFGTNRADLVGDPSVDERTVDRWFNTVGVRATGGRRARQSRAEHRTRARA